MANRGFGPSAFNDCSTFSAKCTTTTTSFHRLHSTEQLPKCVIHFFRTALNDVEIVCEIQDFWCLSGLFCVVWSVNPYLSQSVNQATASTTTNTVMTTITATRRQQLNSGSTSRLLVPPTRRITMGDRAFPVAAARM